MYYRVKALNQHNGVELLTISAPSEVVARNIVQQQGYTVLSLMPNGYALGFTFQHKFPLQIFSHELDTLVSAGLSLVESLEALAERESNLQTKKMVQGLLERLRCGLAFSAALEGYPDYFPELFVSMVRASEQTGDLSVALSRYIAYWEQTDKVRNKLVSASIYPAIIAMVGVLVALFLLFYVVPRFAKIYDDIHGDIPFLSRMMLEWGKFVESHGGLVVLLSLLILSGVAMLITQPAVRAATGQALLRIPIVHERYRVYQLARLYRTLGMLLRGGIPVMQSIGMVIGLIGVELRTKFLSAATEVRAGNLFSTAMEEHGLTTPVALRLLRVGERTGQIGEMMEQIAVFHDEELARWIDWVTKLFEPLLMVVIGLLIGGVVILMYMPIFELAGSIQ